MYWGTWNDNNVQAQKIWEEDKKRRERGFTGTKDGATFKEASNRQVAPASFQSRSQIKGQKSTEWEKKYLHELPRTFGRSYDEKFQNYAKMMGLGSIETANFRRFLDAKEKKLTTTDFINETMNDALSRAKLSRSEKEDEAPIVQEKRGRLDRIFDPLMIGSYMSANVTNNVLNKDMGWKGVVKGLKDGLKASNPFGDGFEKGEMTYSKVMKNAGWKAEGTGEKIARGALGFGLDILLDPTTYMTFGTGALLKGAGKATISSAKLLEGAKKVEGVSEGAKKLFSKGTMNDEMARKIVTDHLTKGGKAVDEETVVREAEALKNKFHNVLGTNRKNEGIGIGIKHSLLNPVLKGLSGGNETIKKIADFHINIPGTRALMETASKLSMADRAYSNLRKTIYGTQIGKLFSTKHGLTKMMEQDPVKLYEVMDNFQKSKGIKGDKIQAEQDFRKYARENLNDLSPADVDKLLKALQDKSMFATVKRVSGLSKHGEVKRLKSQLKREQDVASTHLSELAKNKQMLDQLKSAKEMEVDGAKQVYSDAENEYLLNLHNLDLEKLQGTKEYDDAVNEIKRQVADLDARYERIFHGQADTIKHYEVKSPEHADLPEMPIKPEDPDFKPVAPKPVDVPMKPTRPYSKKADIPQPPKLDEVPEKVYPKEPQMSDLVDENTTELQFNASGMVDEWKKAQGGKYVDAKVKERVYAQLGELLYGDAEKISYGTAPREINELIKMIDEGRNENYIKSYIEAYPHKFDGRGEMIDSYVAKQIGYGKDPLGNDLKYPDWNAYYYKRMQELDSLLEGEKRLGELEAIMGRRNGTLTPEQLTEYTSLKGKRITSTQRTLYNQLVKDNLKRSAMRSELQAMDMPELKKYLKDRQEEELFKDFEVIENREAYGKGIDRDKWQDAVSEKAIDDENLRQTNTSSSQEFEEVFDEEGNLITNNVEQGFKEISYRDPKTGEYKSEIVPRDKEFETKRKNFVLNADEISAVEMSLYGELSKNGTKEFTEKHTQYVKDVTTRLGELLNGVFKQPFFQLSDKAREFAIKLAKRDVYNESRGMVKPGQALIEDKIIDKAHKVMEKRMELNKDIMKAEAVHTLAEKGSPVLFMKGKKVESGKIIEIEKLEDGITTVYTIRTKDGREINDVFAKDISHVEGVRPVKHLMENKIEKDFAEATRKYEEEVRRIDAEHEAKTKEVAESNAKKMEDFKAEFEKFKNDKTLAKEQYDKELANYEKAQAELDKSLADADELSKANHEAEKNKLSEQYDRDMQEYNKKKLEYDNNVKLAELMNEANKKDWEDSIRASSKVADDYFNEKEILKQKLADVQWTDIQKEQIFGDTKQSMEEAWQKVKDDSVNNIANLEKEAQHYQDQLDGLSKSLPDPPERIQARFDELNDILKSDEAFETYLELNHASDVAKWDRQLGNENLGMLVIDTKTDYSEKLKRITKELRKHFDDMGQTEKDANIITGQQFDAWVGHYLPHIITPSGKEFFQHNSIREIDGELVVTAKEAKTGGSTVTTDLGYDEVFNPHNQHRTFKVKLPDGTWTNKPTIEQINEVMRPFLKGDNAFSQDISEIFLSRAMKHTEVMYDDTYMRNMMNDFGSDLNPDFTANKNYKAVMNFGGFRKNLNELARLQVSMQMSDSIATYMSNVVQPELDKLKYFDKAVEDDYISKRISEFLDQEFPPEVRKEMFDSFHDNKFSMIGMDKKTFRDTATPMLEMKPEQLQILQEQYKDIVNEFRDKVYKMGQNVTTPEQIERVKKAQETLDNLHPLEMKQVHEVIVDKANKARQIQFNKDKSKFLGLYDKFTHFMKLNQTAVLPSFHARNAYSNMFQVWLSVGNDMADFKGHKAVMNAMTHRNDAKKLASLEPLKLNDGTTMTWDEVLTLAEKYEVIDWGMFAKDLGAEDASNGVLKKWQHINIPGTSKQLNLDPTDTMNNTFYKTGTAIGTKVENQARLFQFASLLKQGKSIDEAKELVDKFLFDYSDITEFERTVMKRIFPFYTWMRKNGRLQVSQLVEQPGKYRDVAKGMNAVESGVDEEDRVLPQFMAPFARDWKQTIFNYTSTDEDGNEVVEPVLWNPNLPFMDLTRLANPLDPAGAIKTLLPQMNSAIKSPIELGLNKNFFFDDRINHKGESKVKTTADYLASQFTPYQQAKDLITKKGVDRGFHALNDLTGQKFLSYDYETSKSMIEMESKSWYKPKEKPLWVDKKMDKISMEHIVSTTQADVTRMTDDFINGKEMTEENTGLYAPFFKVMKSVGADNAKSRKWVSSLVNSTSLEKYLIGSDFTEAKVLDVRDGDTIDVEINGKKSGIRMNLVDTPETVDARVNKPMPFGKDASNLTHETFKDGKNIQLVLSNQKDKYDRYVAYVYIDGVDYNKELIDKGLAKVSYANLSTNPYREKEYRKVQEEAVADDRGIWQIPGYADPKKDVSYNKTKALEKYVKLLQEQGDTDKLKQLQEEIKAKEAENKLKSYQRYSN